MDLWPFLGPVRADEDEDEGVDLRLLMAPWAIGWARGAVVGGGRGLDGMGGREDC